MQVGVFTMPMHSIGKDWRRSLAKDREAFILADERGFTKGYVGERATAPEENITSSALFLAKIRAIVRDEAIAEALAPRDHPIGTKRICVDTQYYATFNRENVVLVDVRRSPIEAITLWRRLRDLPAHLRRRCRGGLSGLRPALTEADAAADGDGVGEPAARLPPRTPGGGDEGAGRSRASPDPPGRATVAGG